MKGINQKTVVSSTVSSEYVKKVVDTGPKASQPVSQSAKRSAGGDPIVSHPDPTRFGDWEQAGRCIDF